MYAYIKILVHTTCDIVRDIVLPEVIKMSTLEWALI